MFIKESILKTLAWFELFEHPLTQKELFGFLWRSPKISYEDFVREIDNLVNKKVIGKEQDFYFLYNKNGLVEKRLEKEKFVDNKLSILKKAVKKMRYVPFLEAVFLCNNLSFKTAKENSDIDVFIIAKDGRIWIVRFFTTVILSLFGLRRTKKKIKDKICLSFYCSSKYLNLRTIQINDKPDVYLIYWLSQLVPIYDVDNVQEKIKKGNSWIKDYLNNVDNYELFDKFFNIQDDKFSRIFKSFFQNAWKGKYGDLVEKQLCEMQKTKMKMNAYSKQAENDTEVIINDKMLKFHENDRREYYKKKWNELTKNY